MLKGRLIATITIIVSVMFCGYFGMNYMKEREGQEALASQVADVSQTLAELPELPQDLEQRLATAQARLDAEKDALPDSINSIEVVNAILELADECEVRAVPLVTQPRATVTIGEHDYHVLRLNVAVEGSLTKLLTFVGKLERGEFETLIVERLDVERGIEESEDSEESEGSEETIPVIASLNLAIYTQSLSSD